jgi:acetylornithine deacetylase/succinyl-diaminopimelate desuccinylase-like protein
MLANIAGPSGREEPVGECVYQWLVRHDMPAAKQLVTGSRFNVLSTLRGAGGGPSLALNAHMDTVAIFQGEAQTGLHDINAYQAWREEDRLFGLAVVNDRGCLATFLAAGKALKEAGIRLRGDLVMTAVVGEIGAAPVEEYQGPEFLGKGIGTRHALAYGPHVDYALVAETTDFAISWVECGVAYIKVNVVGESIYSPRTRPKVGTPLEQEPNAIYRTARVLEAIQKWAATYPDRHALPTACGLVRPKVNVGAIRGGSPCRPSETAASCSIYLDVWQAPGMPLRISLDELRQVLDKSGVRASIEVYMTRNGYIGKGVEPLAQAVAGAYQGLAGLPVPAASEDVLSMWRDTNVYNEFGVPALTFGPTRHKTERPKQLTAFKHHTTARHLTIPDMVLAARVYAKTAMELCGVAE